MAASVVSFRSPALQTKVCRAPQCAKAGAPQPIENFYGNRTAKDGKQAICKECDRARSAGRVDAGLRVVSEPPPAEPVDDAADDVDESFAPENFLDRAWRIYERDERLRRAAAKVGVPVDDFTDRRLHNEVRLEQPAALRGGIGPEGLLEAERFANEVLAELRAGASLGEAIDRANADTSKLGAEERPLDLFKSGPAMSPGAQRRTTHDGQSEGAVHDGYGGGDKLRGQRGDDRVAHGGADAGQRSREQHVEPVHAGRRDQAHDLQPGRVRGIQAGGDVLRGLHAGAGEGSRREACGLTRSATQPNATALAEPRTEQREGSPPNRGNEPAAPPALTTGGDSALSDRPAALGRPLPTPAPPPSGPRALVQVMTLDRFEEQHMPQPTGLVDRIRARLARSPAGLVELQRDLKEDPQKIRAALRYQAKRGFMRVDDAGRWSVVNASPARGGAAHRNGGAPELVEVEPRSIAAAKAAARSRPAPASTSLAGFVPPPHVAEHDQFGRDLLVLRERVIARAIARVAKIDEMLAMGFSE